MDFARQSPRMGAMDAWRAILPMMGVVYHSINAEMRNGRLMDFSPLLNSIHSFRMESFFAMAGLLAGNRLARSNYLGLRLQSIFLPIVSLWVIATATNPNRGFALLTGRTEHLWFLLCLAELSLITWLAHRIGLMRRLDNAKGWIAIAAIGLPLVVFTRLLIAATRPEVGSSLSFTVVQSLYYAPYYLFGIVVARNDKLSLALRRHRKAWLVGPAALILLLAIGAFDGSPFSASADGITVETLRILCATGIAVTVVGTSIGLAWVASPSVVWLANAGYTVYLLHFPLVKIGNMLFGNFDILPRVLHVMLLSAGGSLFIFWLLTHSPILRTLINGVSLTTRSSRPFLRWIWQSGVELDVNQRNHYPSRATPLS